MEEKYRKDLPVIGITMGDPAGIGPEIIIKVLSQSYSLLPCIPVIVGDSVTLERAARFVGWDGHVHCISGPEEARYLPNHIQTIVPEGLGPIPCEPGSEHFVHRTGKWHRPPEEQPQRAKNILFQQELGGSCLLRLFHHVLVQLLLARAHLAPGDQAGTF